jgi:CelD/BcsL family acetyltransferase involved in cellulose biosynthesis
MASSLTSSDVERTRTAFRPPPQQVVRWARPRQDTHRPAPVHQIEWITEPERFAELAEPWDWLAARQPTPFGRHAWFSAWWDAFGAQGQLSVCAVWRGRRLVAALPLWRRGQAMRVMANVHTPVFQVPACDHRAREAAFSAALRAAPGALEVEALAATDPALPALAKDSRGARRVALVESLHTSPIIDLREDFAAYARLHPTRTRKLAKLGRRMRRDHQTEVVLLEAPAGLDRELERCFELEAAGWKGAAGTAIISAEETARFYRSVASAYQRLGELRLSTITLDGELATFDLCLLHANRLWTLKSAYNESYRRLSPGMVLLLWEIERSFELGLEAVELLGGSEDYKLAFATSEREHRRFRAYRRRPASLAQFAYRRWARPVLRNGYRQLPGRSRGSEAGIRSSRPTLGDVAPSPSSSA